MGHNNASSPILGEFPPTFTSRDQALQALNGNQVELSDGRVVAVYPQLVDPPNVPINPHASPIAQQLFYDAVARALAADYLAKTSSTLAEADAHYATARSIIDANRNYFQAGLTPRQMPDWPSLTDTNQTQWERSNLGTHFANAFESANFHYVDKDQDGTQSYWGPDVTADSYRGEGPVTRALQAHPHWEIVTGLAQAGALNPFPAAQLYPGLNPSYDPETRERLELQGSFDFAAPGRSSIAAHRALDVRPALPTPVAFVDYERLGLDPTAKATWPTAAVDELSAGITVPTAPAPPHPHVTAAPAFTHIGVTSSAHSGGGHIDSAGGGKSESASSYSDPGTQ